MSGASSASVETYTTLFQGLLQGAQSLKPTDTIEPALRIEDLEDSIARLRTLAHNTGTKTYAAIETAVRKIFYNLLVTSCTRT